MEESSERPVRLREYEIPEYSWTGVVDISMVDDDMTIISISREDRAAKYQQMIEEMKQESLRWLEIRDFFSSDREI
ncbi:unnamed protein product [Arabis nemorensis]|uniref:Uncharacterized protein n=1 Tax=Arabis nemorensis TaxID=586526 RepID=A0A565CAN4_9BRAS|nr:unnamed protein product [Arabis nemorensis]